MKSEKHPVFDWNTGCSLVSQQYSAELRDDQITRKHI